MKRAGGLTFMWLLWALVAAGATLRVPDDHATIQGAVDAAAPGDTVMVAAGTYEEQVVITSDLVLLGDGPSTTLIQAPTDMSHSVGYRDEHAVVSIEEPADIVVVSGFTVDGLGRAPETGYFDGVLFYEAGGELSDMVVRNIHRTPVTDNNDGLCVKTFTNIVGPPRPITMRNIETTRFQKAGIVLNGPYQADLSDIRIDTDGLYSDAVQLGLECSFVLTATIRGIEIEGVTYDSHPSPGYTAVGLLGYFSGYLDVSDLEARANQTAVYLVGTDAVIEDASITAKAEASLYNHGVVAVTSLNVAAGLGSGDLPSPRPLAEGDQGPVGRPIDSWLVELRDCLLEGDDSDSSRGLAMRCLSAHHLRLVAERCRLQGWESGVVSQDAGVGRVYARLSGCRIVDNTNWGVFAAAQVPVDARGCWWNALTGPFHPTKNPLGLGDTVSDNVLFDPWVRGNLAPLPLPQTIALDDLDPTSQTYRDTVVVEYLGGGAAPLYGHSTILQWDPAVVTMVEVSRPAQGEFADAVLFEVLPDGDGVRVDSALGGAHPGVESAPLFRLVFEAVGTPDYTVVPLDLVLRHARDPFNESIDGLTTDQGELRIDLQAPVISSLTVTNATLDHTDLFAKDGDMLSVAATISDADPAFDEEGIRGVGAELFGLALPYDPPDVYLAPQAIWVARPALLYPADGTVTFRLEAWDPSGNVTAMVATQLTADNTAPAPAGGLVVTHGHNLVEARWDDPTGTDLNFRRLHLRSNAWNDYPRYDNGDPGYPALITDGQLWYAGPDTAVTVDFAADGTERDIFYLSAMVEDMAGNQSTVDAGNRARTINYILGDVRGTSPATPGDGVVTIHDITRLGDTFDLIDGEAGFDAECDIAPATTAPEIVPVPDGEVGFDDLMIMAGQFDPEPGAEPAPATGDDPVLAWRDAGPGVWALDLLEPCPRLKGVHLTGGGQGHVVQPGALLALQAASTFVRAGRRPGEAHLAVLGRGIGLEGHGELLRLVGEPGAVAPIPMLDLRDVNNEPLACNLPTSVDPSTDIPQAFRAGLPTPNPFNPRTTLHFDLPSAQRVHLTVYDPGGRRVARLLVGDLLPGRHEVSWRGRNHAGHPVAAGTYLYLLEAGPWSASGKLELVK